MEKSKDRRNITPFNGSKYNSWKHRIRNLLCELDVLKVIEVEPPQPVTEAWNKAERVAKCTIVEYLGDTHLKYDKPGSTAKQIMQQLDNVYERKSSATELAVRNRLHRLKMKSDMKLKEHFEVFDDLLTELAAAGVNIKENEAVSYLLSSLPSAYDTVSIVLETITENDITLDFVKTKLQDHETKITGESTETSAKVLQVKRFENDSKRKNYGE